MLPKALLTFPPSRKTTTTIRPAMAATMRPYSTAVAPASSLRNRWSSRVDFRLSFTFPTISERRAGLSRREPLAIRLFRLSLTVQRLDGPGQGAVPYLSSSVGVGCSRLSSLE